MLPSLPLTDLITHQALQLGKEVKRQELERRYEAVCLVLAFSVCINIGVIIWVTIRVVEEFVSF